MIVLAANNLSSSDCGHSISFDVTQSGRGAKSSASKIITKTIWSCCVEAVLEYCRVVFDLFPDQCQVCVAAVDEAKCQPVNSWRDEDQEVMKVAMLFTSSHFYIFRLDILSCNNVSVQLFVFFTFAVNGVHAMGH